MEIMSMNNFDKFVYEMLAEEKIKGGLADNISDMDLATKWGISEEELLKIIKKGIKVELEHTDDKAKAREIVRDHIMELGPNYYKELKKMENKLKKENTPEEEPLIDESMVAGGVTSIFGPNVTDTSSQFSGDTYAPRDNRNLFGADNPKIFKKIQKRSFPETTILNTKKKKRVNKKK